MLVSPVHAYQHISYVLLLLQYIVNLIPGERGCICQKLHTDQVMNAWAWIRNYCQISLPPVRARSCHMTITGLGVVVCMVCRRLNQ